MATEKVSFTLDKDLVAEARATAGKRGLSRIMNDALSDWLHGRRIDQMLDEMDGEAGPLGDELVQEVRREWRAG